MLKKLYTRIRDHYTSPDNKKIHNRLARKNMLSIIPLLTINVMIILYHIYLVFILRQPLYHSKDARMLDCAIGIFSSFFFAFYMLTDEETRYKTLIPRFLIMGFICLQVMYGMFYSCLLFEYGDYFSSYYGALVWALLVFSISPVFSGFVSIMSYMFFSRCIDYYHFYYNKMSFLMFIVAVWLVSSIHYLFMYAYFKKDLETEHQKEMLAKISRTDALTNLQNRYALKHDIASFIGKEITIIIGDIDNFKNYNDTYGHTVGDLVVKEYGRILTRIFGEDRCYRYGGDELLIITEQSEEEIAISKQDYFESVSQFKVPGISTIPTGSLGAVRGVVNSRDDFMAMLKQADMNLYHVKNTNKGSYFASYYNDK